MGRLPKLKEATAEQRTVSLFTGKTDLESPNARDGSDPTPEDSFHLQMRPRVKWKTFDGLKRHEAKAINALIVVERMEAGVWKYRVYKSGQQLGLFDSISDAADAAEAA